MWVWLAVLAGCAGKGDGSVDETGDTSVVDTADTADTADSADSGDSGCDDPPAWYADLDGDGYGAGDPVVACVAPAGSVLTDGDCDDRNSAIRPGADEVCDGLDNDCDPSTLEDGLAATLDGTGAWVDDTAHWTGGSAGAPLIVALSGGAWNLCSATWSVRLDVTGAAVVRGHGDVVLSGESVGTVVNAHGEDAELTLSGVTVTGGRSSVATSSGGTGGGGLACGDGARATLADVVLAGNEAGIGGGLLVDGCVLDGTRVSVSANSADYGGGLYVLAGDATFESSGFADNVAATSGGGIGLEGVYGPVTITLVDTSVSDNAATYGGGLVLYEEAAASLVGTKEGLPGFTGNDAGAAGGAVYMTGGDADPQLDVVLYDFGDGATDNLPTDVSTNAGDYAYGASASFTCSNAGCEGG